MAPIRKIEDIYVTQSMMKAWSSGICPLVFKAMWIDETVSFTPSEMMMYGNYFEHQAIGATMTGKAPELTDKMKKSVYFERIQSQVQKWHEIVREMKITNIAPQRSVEGVINFDYDSNVLPVKVKGHFDVDCLVDGVPTIIDLKLTGNVNNMYGDYSWGDPGSMDLKQSIHYKMLKKMVDGVMPQFMYFVFDITPDLGVKIIRADIREVSFDAHQKEIFVMWNEIVYGLMNGFEAKPKYTDCISCPVKCPMMMKVPEIETVEI